MKLITTHETADFDALASCVGLQKLYPGAEIGVCGGFAPNVHQYLTLHGNRFRTQRCQDIDLSDVDLLVVTDVRRRGRLHHVEEVLERAIRRPKSVRIVVWDHHPSAPDDLQSDEEHVQPVGAVTTLVVEELAARSGDIDREEATLFSLGIHEDTGSLGYSRTSSRDAKALAWLLGHGARPGLLHRFLRPPLDAVERSLLVSIVDGIEEVPAFGTRVGVSAQAIDEAPAGLARVTTEAFRMVPHDALFCVYRLPNGKTHIIGRSQSDAVMVGGVLSELGGGGHTGAGSAVVREGSLENVVSRLHSTIEKACRRPEVVRDLMSSPVRTVTPTMPLRELAHSLHEWHHTGAPVVEDGRLIGMISRRDVERATRDGRDSLTVASCMAHPVRTTSPDTPLSGALQQMKAHNIGRLPVLDGTRIVGILSRDDVLGHLYGE
ncbi:MAG: CBS domain-containing protein [Myxococcales bacterium]|nr:CBS domain-containing protein [Myxococcales bacterium]